MSAGHVTAISSALRAGACMLALAGCNRPGPSAAASAVHRLAEADGSIAWRGASACADCDGIDAQLMLRRTGRVSDYTLVETYRVADQGARFVEHGRWQRSDTLLRLHGDAGAMRIYALLDDGRLQSRDSHGRAMLAAEDEMLVPITPTSAP